MTLSKAITGIVASAMLVGAIASPAMAIERYVTIVNRTAYTIVEFYGSNVGSDSWEEDILGYDVIPSGTSMQINFNDGSGYCMFDFKAVFDDGDVLIRKRVNICELETYTYR